MAEPVLPNEFLTKLIDISSRYGTGSVEVDLTLICLIFFVVGFVLAVLLLRGRSNKSLIPDLERLAGINGKIEKLERGLNDFRSETLRSLEVSKRDLSLLGESLKKKFNLELPENAFQYTPSTVEESPISSSAEEPVAEDQNIEPQAIPSEVDESLPTKLSSSRKSLFQKVKEIFSSKGKIDPTTLDEVEMLLISSDIGVKTSEKVISILKQELSESKTVDRDKVFSTLHQQILNSFVDQKESEFLQKPTRSAEGPVVIIVVGVNGVGKTTTVAKLAARWKAQGVKPMLVAADTFRAGAVEQLKIWGERLDVPVISGAADAKPGTVVFDAMVEARNSEIDLVIIDTAGRLHNKSNLMQELSGIKNVIAKHQSSAPHETLLVLDGSTGQNALSQAKEFNEAVSLSGVIITKLDGTPKGGIVVAIRDELALPIRYIGVGEKSEDLRPFNAKDFVDALLID